MNGRQVHNVESHGGDFRQLALHIAKRSVQAGNGRRRSRKELVPRGKPRSFAIDPDREFHLVARSVLQIGVTRHQLHQRLIARVVVGLALLLRQLFQILRPLPKFSGIDAARAPGSFL